MFASPTEADMSKVVGDSQRLDLTCDSGKLMTSDGIIMEEEEDNWPYCWQPPLCTSIANVPPDYNLLEGNYDTLYCQAGYKVLTNNAVS